jgi:hypothetical protein
MARIVILAQSQEWLQPLQALLRERSIEPWVCGDVVDAIAELRGVSGAVLVVHAELGEAEVSMALTAVERRFGDSVCRIVAGDAGGPLPEGVRSHRSDGRFVALRDLILSALDEQAVTSRAPVTEPTDRPGPAPRPEAPTRQPEPVRSAMTYTRVDPGLAPWPRPAPVQPGRLTVAALEALVRTARHDSYHALLGVPPDATPGQVRDAALNLMARIDEEASIPSVHEGISELLAEVRAAVADARDVLSTPALRAAYGVNSRGSSPP